jgi:hypothetical protein
MCNEDFTTSFSYGTDKIADNVIAIVIINAQPVFDSHWQIDRIIHCGNAVSYELRLSHQARAEGPVLNTIRWTPTVEINLVIAIASTHFGSDGKVSGGRPT